MNLNILLNNIDLRSTNVLMITFSAFCAIFVICLIAIRSFMIKKQSNQLNKRLQFWLAEKIAVDSSYGDDSYKAEEEKEKSFAKRVFIPLGEQVGSWMADKTSYAEKDSKRLILIKAGLRDKNAVQLYFAVKILFAAICGIAFFVLFIPIVGTSAAMMYGIVTGGMGMMIPNFALDAMADGRRKSIDKILPDALDLLVICTEAGMGIDQALLKVAMNLGAPGKDLQDEIIITNREMNLGQDRIVCWKNLGERSDSGELKNLALIIAQSEQRGAQIAQVLRDQSNFLRSKRGQKAEEAAAQLTVKMLIPLAVFIFPVIMAMVIGPPMIKLGENFKM